MPVVKEVDEALRNFSKALIPTNEFLEEGKLLAEKMREALRTKSKYSIDRIYCSGSVGKKTAIMCPDFDCTVFINNVEPPFGDVLQDFSKIIAFTFNLNEEQDIRRTQCSIQFKIPELGSTKGAGFEVDLLPAANYRPANVQSKELAWIQRDEVLKRIAKNPKNHHMYSSSLAESQIDFMLDQNEFTHDLVRLAKFWYKSLYIGEYVSGGSSIIELIAVAVARSSSSSLYDAFLSFLDIVFKIERLRLAFYLKGNRWQMFMDLSRGPIPPNMRANFPGIDLVPLERFILEPANHYNNFLSDYSGISAVARKKLWNFAIDTSKHFHIPGVVICMNEPFIPLCNYFRPMPTKLISSQSETSLHLNSSCVEYLCGSITNSVLLNPLIKIRKSNATNTKTKAAMLKLLDGHLKFITTTANAAPFSGKRQSLNEVVDSVCRMIDQDICGVEYPKEWQKTITKCHEEYDVTFTVPITTSNLGSVAIVVSCRWDLRGHAGGRFKQ